MGLFPSDFETPGFNVLFPTDYKTPGSNGPFPHRFYRVCAVPLVGQICSKLYQNTTFLEFGGWLFDGPLPPDSTRWGRLWGLSTRPRDRVQNGVTTRYKSWANFFRQNHYRFCERVPISERQCRPMMATMRHNRAHRLRYRDLRGA